MAQQYYVGLVNWKSNGWVSNSTRYRKKLYRGRNYNLSNRSLSGNLFTWISKDYISAHLRFTLTTYLNTNKHSPRIGNCSISLLPMRRTNDLIKAVASRWMQAASNPSNWRSIGTLCPIVHVLLTFVSEHTKCYIYGSWLLFVVLG